ncbi:purine-cytosine permease [Rhodotorula sp. JG-1b]|nr:purine-cytosine permease [Rhodotorula sp. JG-1b]
MAAAVQRLPLETRSLSVLSEPSAAAEDEEKALSSLDNKETDASVNSTQSKDSLDGVVAAHGAFGKLTRYLAQLGVETRSTERIPEDERDQPVSNFLSMFWFSVNLSFSCLGTGMLGGMYFTLDFPTSMAVIWLGTALGVCVSATMATLGPRTGLRTMAASRFAGGWPGTAIFSILNAMTQLMYAVTTVIVGAQALRSINHDVSLVVGIVILTVVVALLCIWGYQFLHLWERYAWVGCFVIYCIVLGLGTRGQYDVHAGTAEMATGRELQGNVLSFLGIMFSVGSGWTSIAADYNMTLPHTTPTWAIWMSSFIGMYLPIAFTCSVSATFNILTAPDYVAAFEEESLGGVVGHILIANAGGFGKFLMVLLAFSTVSANIPNTYSGALCLQTLHPWLMKIPRIFFVIGFAAIYLVVALVGREHFSEILSNFSAILAYYTAFLSAIVFIEVLWFRRANGPLGGSRTNWDDVTDYKKLPPGIACTASIACTIPLIVLSMAETWYTGPIALAVSKPYGGDLGFEVSAGMATITYFVFRHFEIRYFGR